MDFLTKARRFGFPVLFALLIGTTLVVVSTRQTVKPSTPMPTFKTEDLKDLMLLKGDLDNSFLRMEIARRDLVLTQQALTAKQNALATKDWRPEFVNGQWTWVPVSPPDTKP